MKQEERKFKLEKEAFERKKIKIVKKITCSPLSEREYNNHEPIIKIYPEYNPRHSRNEMRSITMKGWDTMRTIASTPILSERKQTSLETPYEFSTKSNFKENIIKPNTALFSPRQSVLSQGKTIAQLYQTKTRVSSAMQRQRLFSRSRSRNKDGTPRFGSTFSLNWFKGSRSSINFKTARKYELEIIELRKEIQATKEETRDAYNNLNSFRDERQQIKDILYKFSQNVKKEMSLKMGKIKNPKASTIKILKPSWSDEIIDEFKLSEAKSQKGSTVDELPNSNIGMDELIPLKLLESKERVIRLIMARSGLFQNNLRINF